MTHAPDGGSATQVSIWGDAICEIADAKRASLGSGGGEKRGSASGRRYTVSVQRTASTPDAAPTRKAGSVFNKSMISGPVSNTFVHVSHLGMDDVQSTGPKSRPSSGSPTTEAGTAQAPPQRAPPSGPPPGLPLSPPPRPTGAPPPRPTGEQTPARSARPPALTLSPPPSDSAAPTAGGSGGEAWIPEAVPYAFRACIEYLVLPWVLKDEGLFRVSGNKRSIQEYFDTLNAGAKLQLAASCKEPATVCGLLKKLIKDNTFPLTGVSGAGPTFVCWGGTRRLLALCMYLHRFLWRANCDAKRHVCVALCTHRRTGEGTAEGRVSQ